MKKLIKLLPVVLAMLMLFSFGAFAEETGEIPDGEQNVTEITLPEAPTGFTYRDYSSYGILEWERVNGADGYDVFLNEKGEWKLIETTTKTLTHIYDLTLNSKYEIGIRSYIEVDGVKYSSEEYYSDFVYTDSDIDETELTYKSKSVLNGVNLVWNSNQYDNITGYRLYIRKDGKWIKIKDVYGREKSEYLYIDEDLEIGKSYLFGIKVFVKGTEGLAFSDLRTYSLKHEDVRIVKNISSTVKADSVTLKWDKVEAARGYRIFMYQGGKWKAIKTTTSTSYTVTGLEASKKYIFRVRAYEKVNGATVWFPYSKNYSTITGSKTVDAYRIKNLEKSFSDGDWYVQIKNQEDEYGNKITMTFAGKGDNIFYRYQLGKQTIEYFYQASKDRLYIISDADKEYVIVPNDEAESFVESMFVMAEIVKVQNVGKVTAKTCVYNGYSAVQETYTDTVYGFKKTYYFVKDKVAGLTVELEGAKDEYKNFSVVDTPSSSLFKVPSGYKKVSWN